jgi:hypothetical protein
MHCPPRGRGAIPLLPAVLSRLQQVEARLTDLHHQVHSTISRPSNKPCIGKAELVSNLITDLLGPRRRADAGQTPLRLGSALEAV